MTEVLLIQAWYLVFCLTLAVVNCWLILKDKTINHPLNGVLHFIVWCTLALLYEEPFAFLILPFFGKLFFDTTLNLLRGKSWDYVSPEVINGLSRSSTLDQIEWEVFQSGAWPKVTYLVVLICLNLIYYVCWLNNNTILE